ncbi:hypothetical protein [Phage vB_KsaM-C1]|nr:hypothetical protein [Phage vB_KsaM-C1]
MSIKRYDYGYQDEYSADGMTGLQFADDGALVKYNDYVALEQVKNELLEALQELISGYENHTECGMFDMVCHGDEIEKAVKAITKALGKTK